jgi:PAS domain S-box-containing protein
MDCKPDLDTPGHQLMSITVDEWARLNSSEVRYRRLFEAAHDGILVVDPDTRKISDANPFIANLVGYSKGELLGKELWEIGLIRDEAESKKAFQILQETGTIRYEHLPLKAKDGRELHVEFVSNVYEEGDSYVIQCNIRDITGRIAESRRKDEFLAMLAHELRNPLSSISSAITLLQTLDASVENISWSKEIIARQVKHMARIIDDLTDVSRISHGTFNLRKTHIDAAAIIKHAVDTVRPQIEEKEQQLVVSVMPDTLSCEADPTRLEQALTNLLVNASRYTEAGGRIWLTASHGGEHISFKFTDTGIGVLPAKLPQMFELFAQGDRTKARSEGGLGVGLTIANRIAELHEGSVTAFSEGLGKGSAFTLTLPATREPKPVPAGPPIAAPAQKGHSRILIVDDNVDIATGLDRLLTPLGHEIHIAHDGPDAITEALAFRPDFILLDIGLPSMDGYEVARRLRAEGLRTAVIIAITGYGQEEDRYLSKEAGFNFHLVKPIDFIALVSLIAQPVA